MSISGRPLKPGSKMHMYWHLTEPGQGIGQAGGFNSHKKLHPGRPANTAVGTIRNMRWDEPRELSDAEVIRIQGFPDDYQFMSLDPGYVCGMSVPPPMMQRVATEVAKMLTTNELPPLHTGPWKLTDLNEGRLGRPRHGLKVFSTFSCGGGSTMGYKLAGYDVLGFCEIDKKMASIYQHNHTTKYQFIEGIQDFKRRPDLPPELYDLDVLDGSPPCSQFSMAGEREKNWGKEKSFREGQSLQRLDDLFFHFIDLGSRLRPKFMVAENVKGLIAGNARGYVKEIFQAFRSAGYETQLFLLNASRMGVPQRRERTFFIARRMDLNLKKLTLDFHEPEIPVRDAFRGIDPVGREASDRMKLWWSLVHPGQSFSKAHPKGHWFNFHRLAPDRPAPTVPSQTLTAGGMYLWDHPVALSMDAIKRIQSFPDDYQAPRVDLPFLVGMSVPPLMMQRVASEVAKIVTRN